MNLRAPIRYHLLDCIKSTVIFYMVIICFMIFSLPVIFISSNSHIGSISMGGIEAATIIFLFIVGLNSFKDTFRMFIQNSVSRKKMFLSLISSVAILSIAMALLGNVIILIGKTIESVNDQFIYQSFFEQLYMHRYVTNSNDIQMYIESLFFLIFIFAASFMIGYFITVLYYRMNKACKIAVSVGVPIGYIIVLPIIDYAILNGAINQMIRNSFVFAFGFSNGQSNPYYGMTSCVLICLVFGGLSWLMMRRAVIKD